MSLDPENDALSPQVDGMFYGTHPKSDTWRVAEEMPLVIFYNSEQFGVMMVTPTQFEDFAIGFSLTEGIVSSKSEIEEIRLEAISEGMLVNIIVPAKALATARQRKRNITGGASCGICGAQTLEAALGKPLQSNGVTPEPEVAIAALKTLFSKQVHHQQNYSTHAAALVDLEGKFLLLREDVGRHNALDKLCGAMAGAQLTPKEGFLVLSSRFSLEMVQKAATTRFAYVATVSAPTALALKVAEQAKMRIATLSGDGLMVFA